MHAVVRRFPSYLHMEGINHQEEAYVDMRDVEEGDYLGPVLDLFRFILSII